MQTCLWGFHSHCFINELTVVLLINPLCLISVEKNLLRKLSITASLYGFRGSSEAGQSHIFLLFCNIDFQHRQIKMSLKGDAQEQFLIFFVKQRLVFKVFPLLLTLVLICNINGVLSRMHLSIKNSPKRCTNCLAGDKNWPDFNWFVTLVNSLKSSLVFAQEVLLKGKLIFYEDLSCAHFTAERFQLKCQLLLGHVTYSAPAYFVGHISCYLRRHQSKTLKRVSMVIQLWCAKCITLMNILL